MTSLLKIENLRKQFRNKWALDDVSFDLIKGETLGLVGESGSGKSTLAKILVGLEVATEGRIAYKNRDLTNLKSKQWRPFRKRIQMVFQNPYTSLNPRMKVKSIIAEGLDIHKLSKGTNRNRRIHELIEFVGLESQALERYPHEFSGGQRQRIGIARALAVEPEILICDEPTSALDVSIQAQIINLLKSIQKKMGLTLLFISHNLAVVEYMSDRVAVMKSGRIVELAPTKALYSKPLHPYTQALFSAIPIPDPKEERARRKLHQVSDPVEPIGPLIEVNPGHFVARDYLID